MRPPHSDRGTPFSLSPYDTLSHTVFHGNRPKCWKTIATCGLGSTTGCSSSSTRPRVGCSRPPRQRSSVVLPQPEGPTMHSVRFAGMSRFRSWKATTAPAENVRVAPSTRILAAAVIPTLVPARVPAPRSAVALHRFVHQGLVRHLRVGRLVLRLHHAQFHVLVQCVVDQLLGHTVVDRPDAALRQLVVGLIDDLGL